MGIASGIVASGGTTTTDATAEQWHIKSGKTAYIASGKVTGNAYTPAMMVLDGSTGYYAKSGLTYAGNKVTAVARFTRADFTGDVFERIIWASGTGGVRCVFTIFSSNHSTLTNRQGKLQVDVQNTSGTTICKLLSSSTFLDGLPHTVYFEFDGDAGTAELIVDGSDEDATGNPDRVAPTTGTLPTSAGLFHIGTNFDGTAEFFEGNIGFVGYMDAGGLTWSDFMRSDGSPIYQNPASSWAGSGFGSQPKFFNPHGDMVNNLGSAGAMTKNGTINVGDGGT